MKTNKKGTQTYILLAAILVMAFGIMIANRVTAGNGAVAEVSVDGAVIKELPLSKDCECTIDGIDGKNYLVIKDGVCFILEANCPDKLCVKQGRIEKIGETIICLPHRVVVTIKGDRSGDIDSISE